MAEDRIAFSHSSINGTTLRKPLTPVIPSPHPHSEGAVIYAWPLTAEQEPDRIIAADRIGISIATQVGIWDEAGNVLKEPLAGDHLAPMCRIESDYLLSAVSAHVFSRFDLGRSTLKRVPVVKQGNEEIPGDWYFLHVGERKETLVPLKADKFRSPSAKSTTVLAQCGSRKISSRQKRRPPRVGQRGIHEPTSRKRFRGCRTCRSLGFGAMPLGYRPGPG